MCGASNSLEELIFWRILQGAAGAPLVPLGQTLLLDSSPRSQHVTVISIFGMANMIGPSLGSHVRRRDRRDRSAGAGASG